MSSNSLTLAEKKHGQRCITFANSLSHVENYVMFGALMMLFVNDVLKFSPVQISTIVAIIPMMAVFRIPLVSLANRIGKVKSILISASSKAVLLLVLYFLPTEYLNFWTYTPLILVYAFMTFGVVSLVWQPLIHDVTDDHDRGRFFARMRFLFKVITTVFMASLPFLVGSTITSQEYGVFILLALVCEANLFFWVRQVKELRFEEEEEDAEKVNVFKATWELVKKSELIGLPLLVVLLVTIGTPTIYIIYLKKMMNVPSDYVTIFIFFETIGGAATLLLWGKIADTIGFRPLLMGLLYVAIGITPLHLLMTPFDQSFNSLGDLELHGFITFCILLLYGFISGAIVAGIGIATTSIQHHFVEEKRSIEIMNIFSLIISTISGVFLVFTGYLIEEIAIPRGTTAFFNDIFYFDWFKAYLIFFVPLLYGVTIYLASKMPNAIPYFTTSAFFTSISLNSFANLVVSRKVYNEDESVRSRTARWYGDHLTPLGMDTLIKMLDDPSYDVKIAAIHSLALNPSEQAASALMEILQDEEEEKRHIFDHVAWALGEMKYQGAYPVLIDMLGEQWPHRLRAMAARSLGKLGNPDAVSNLVKSMEDEKSIRHTVSSCCLAILQIEGLKQPRKIFNTLIKLNSRFERYEIMAAICKYMNISNDWLLHYRQRPSSYEALIYHIESQSARWQKENAYVIKMLKAHDNEVLYKLVDYKNEAKQDPIVNVLSELIRADDHWTSLNVLASAYLLLSMDPVET